MLKISVSAVITFSVMFLLPIASLQQCSIQNLHCWFSSLSRLSYIFTVMFTLTQHIFEKLLYLAMAGDLQKEEPFSLAHRWDESQPLRMITSALKFQNAQKNTRIYLTSDAIVTSCIGRMCCSCLRCQQKINNTKIVALCGDVNNNVSHVHLWLRLNTLCAF